MKAFSMMLLVCCLSTMARAQTTKPALSPLMKHYLIEIQNKRSQEPLPGYCYYKSADGTLYINVLIKVSNAQIAQSGLDAVDAKVGTKAGAIWTVKVPVPQVKPLTQVSGISYIQMDEPVQPHLDMARKTTRTDSAQAGYGLPMGYSGKGVVMGVIDFGFDYNHPTFYDTLGAVYRGKRAWEMEATGTPPTGYIYGKEITDTNLLKAEGTDNAAEFHGTSTTGMAAGSGFGSLHDSRYRGMAYDADIVWVGVRRDSIGGQWLQGSFSDFIDGINYIFNYATSVGEPAVVNISWGSESGSHDGTSLFNQACDALAGPGRIIVMSAGNEGTENIHLAKTFTATDTVIKTYLTFTPATYRRTWVDIWGETGKTFCASTTLYSNGVAGNTTGFQCINDSITDEYLIGADGTDTCYVEYITSSAEATNGKPRTTINIYNKSTDSIGVIVKANDGTINMWDEYYYYGFPYAYQSAFDSLGDPSAVSGNSISAISDMGSGQSVLLVGAYASKVEYVDINGHAWTYGSYVAANYLVPFSSKGPMIDGRIKPDITAPGITIATSMSSYDTAYTATGSQSSGVDSKYFDSISGKTYYYAEFSGTSASAPAASGIVALMLQANPSMTPDNVKTTIFQTAITDAHTGTLPAAGLNTWGHGKINAYGALKKMAQTTGVYNYTGPQKLDCVLFPNPNNGGFSLEYTTNSDEHLQVAVMTATGKSVYTKSWTVTRGLNRYPIDVSYLPKGIYVVNVSGENGTVSIKTIIQ